MTDDFNSFLSVNPSLYYSSCSNMYYPRCKLPVVLSNRQWQSEIHVLGIPIRLNRIWSEKIEKLGPFRSDRSVGGLLHIYIMVFVCKYNSEATKPTKCQTIIELCPPQHHNNYRKIIIHPKSEIIHWAKLFSTGIREWICFSGWVKKIKVFTAKSFKPLKVTYLKTHISLLLFLFPVNGEPPVIEIVKHRWVIPEWLNGHVGRYWDDFNQIWYTVFRTARSSGMNRGARPDYNDFVTKGRRRPSRVTSRVPRHVTWGLILYPRMVVEFKP